MSPEEWEDLGKAEEMMEQKTRDHELTTLLSGLSKMLERQ